MGGMGLTAPSEADMQLNLHRHRKQQDEHVGGQVKEADGEAEHEQVHPAQARFTKVPRPLNGNALEY
jgi:hypothetical protein